MAGGRERALRRRIRSVQSTKKITRAMELIAATRVAKAQQRAAAARPYSENLTGVIQHLAENGGITDHPLMVPPKEVKKVAFVVITSDRGLAGGYNSSVIKAAEREIDARRNEGADYSLILIGKKADGHFRFRGYNIDASFNGISDTPTYADAQAVGAVVSEKFSSGEVQEVVLVFTRFISVGTQQVVVRQFMPLTGVGEEHDDKRAGAAYEFEPAPATILETLLPRYVNARLFAALLDSAASEHASRQRAMKAATDNAEELIVKLSRVMNRARQDAITTEITEIVGGAEALHQSAGSDPDDLLLDNVFPEDPFDHSAHRPTRTHQLSAGEKL
ncbi:MAG: F0F1 ATP synthase subunit gamma [Acidimicrobiales bacterium]|nr:F0F1 ATP synthase subunit gamma [Acidimicrobiales bacterium]